jgi:hypothetical protein
MIKELLARGTRRQNICFKKSFQSRRKLFLMDTGFVGVFTGP